MQTFPPAVAPVAPVAPETAEPPVDPATPVAPDAVDMVATVGAAVPAAMVEPPCAAICSLSDFSLSLAVLYFSVAAALRLFCFATAAVAVDLAVSFFVESLLMSSAEQGVARGVWIAFKASTRGVTPAGLFVKVSVMSSINVSTEVQVVGTG
jgi:hypothetical protein